MANTTTNISFYKGESFSTYETGAVYFETSTHTIKVATSETAADIYCGVRSATLGADSKLTIVNEAGTSIVLDFSDIASATTLQSLLDDFGEADNLDTTSKTAVGAINELKSRIDALDNSSASYELVLNDDGSVQCIKNGTDEGFVLNSDGSVSLG